MRSTREALESLVQDLGYEHSIGVSDGVLYVYVNSRQTRKELAAKLGDRFQGATVHVQTAKPQANRG